jgi:hypothetical protein
MRKMLRSVASILPIVVLVVSLMVLALSAGAAYMDPGP